jgi:hypothetical protein
MRSVGEVMAIGMDLSARLHDGPAVAPSPGALSSCEPLELPTDPEARTEKVRDTSSAFPVPERRRALFHAFFRGGG